MEVEDPPTVLSAGCSEAGGASTDPPESHSGAAGGGDGAVGGKRDSSHKVSFAGGGVTGLGMAGGTCTTCGPSASTAVLTETTSKLLG